MEYVQKILKVNKHQIPNPDNQYITLIIIGIIIVVVAGSAGVFIYRSKKHSRSQTTTTPDSDSNSSKNGKTCNVCGTFISKEQNVCPNCGDTYSV